MRGPQTIWRIYRSSTTVTCGDQRRGRARVSNPAGTQPRKCKIFALALLYHIFLFRGSVLRGPQTIWRCYIRTKIDIPQCGEIIRIKASTKVMHGTQPGNSELLSCFIVPQKRIRPNFSAEFFRRGIDRICFVHLFGDRAQKFLRSLTVNKCITYQFGISVFYNGRAMRGAADNSAYQQITQ